MTVVSVPPHSQGIPEQDPTRCARNLRTTLGYLASTTFLLLVAGMARADMTITGDVNVTGHLRAGSISAATIDGALNVAGPSVLGDTAATSLSVSGASELDSLTVSGSSTLQAAAIRGNAAVAGALNVTGQSTFADTQMQSATVQKGLNVNGPMGVRGTASFGSDMVVSGAGHFGSASVTGTTSTGSLTVDGASRLDTLTVSANSTLQDAAIRGNAAVAGALDVTGQSTFTDAQMQTATVQTTLNVNGPMDVRDTASFGSDMAVSGTGHFGSASVTGTTSTGSLTVDGTSRLDTLTVSGNSTLADVDVLGPLAVTGAASFVDLASESILAEDLHVTGNLTIDGGLTLPSRFSFGQLEATGSSKLNDVEVVGKVAMNNASSSFTLDSSGVQASTGAGRMQLTDSTAALAQGENGITASSAGTTKVTAIREATLQGGETRLTLTDRGARLSGSGGAPARLSGVADGINEDDAVNVRQLNEGLQEVGAGVAMSMAMSQLPSPLAGSNHAFGIGLGNFDGQAAMALGGTAILSNGVTLRGALSHASGKTGAGVGVGWSF
ncbi:helicase (plasmid) [Cereibacter sphaeroides]|nr:helicase [Cereibacter sphaeroides]